MFEFLMDFRCTKCHKDCSVSEPDLYEPVIYISCETCGVVIQVTWTGGKREK